MRREDSTSLRHRRDIPEAFRFLFTPIPKSCLRIGGGGITIVIVLSPVSRYTTRKTLARPSGANDARGRGTAKLQNQNLRESEEAGQVVPIKEPTPQCESQPTRHDHNAVFASNARFAMNNFY